MNPLVSVICVCYNHEPYVIEALESVKFQNYSNIEIIVVDDGSQDKSADKIQEWVNKNPATKFLNLKLNQGYCKAFNKALAQATGEFIIDFAADDIMIPYKVEEQVNYFSSLDSDYGVVFSDADYIDKDGKYLRSHFAYLFKNNLINKVPQGDIYSDVLSTYFIPSPTMMAKAIVYKTINGYDENLAYEDFDFWVRSSRQYKYGYLPKKLMKIRRNINSMSSRWYKQGDRQLHSTYLVCQKALHLNRNESENNALAFRLKYELRQSVFSENTVEADLFYNMLCDMSKANSLDKLTLTIGKLNLPLSSLRKFYHSMRYELFS